MSDDARERLEEVVAGLSYLPIGVVGDLVAEIFLAGVPERLSREAPILVLQHDGETLVPGGAAYVAMVLGALGAHVHLIGIVGADPAGTRLVETLKRTGLDTSGIVVSDRYETPTRTRIMAGSATRAPRSIVRVDRTWNGPLPSGASGELLTRVRTVADRISGWAFCDRGSGAAAPGAVAMLPGIRVVDSSARLATFPAVTVATLNEEGAAAFTGRSAAAEGDVRAAAKAILEKTGSENVVVTRGRLGLALFGTEGRELFLPARGTGAVDPLGAGDVVTAVLAGALTAGATPEEAATLANHAAGVAVGKTGLAVIAPRELVERICAG